MQISFFFFFCKTCIHLKILENIHISVNMIDDLLLLITTQLNVFLSWMQLLLLMQC